MFWSVHEVLLSGYVGCTASLETETFLFEILPQRSYLRVVPELHPFDCTYIFNLDSGESDWVSDVESKIRAFLSGQVEFGLSQ
jgi:hypothetical protein